MASASRKRSRMLSRLARASSRWMACSSSASTATTSTTPGGRSSILDTTISRVSWRFSGPRVDPCRCSATSTSATTGLMRSRWSRRPERWASRSWPARASPLHGGVRSWSSSRERRSPKLSLLPAANSKSSASMHSKHSSAWWSVASPATGRRSRGSRTSPVCKGRPCGRRPTMGHGPGTCSSMPWDAALLGLLLGGRPEQGDVTLRGFHERPILSRGFEKLWL